MDTVGSAKRLVARTGELVAALRSAKNAVRERLATARRLASEARHLTSVAPHDLMPLDMAVATVFRRAYEPQMRLRVDVRPTGELDGLAYTLAELAPLFAYDPEGNSIRKLSKDDLSGALFRGGAKALTYVDGRAPITNLAISAKSLPALIKVLKATRTAGGVPGT